HAAIATSALQLQHLLPGRLLTADRVCAAGELDLLRSGQPRAGFGCAGVGGDKEGHAHAGAEACQSAQGLPQAEAQEEARGVRKARQKGVRAEEEGEEGRCEIEGSAQVTAPCGRAIRRGLLVSYLLAGLVLGALAGAPAAGAEGAGSAWWSLTASRAPTNLPPGGEGQIYITAVNVGDANVNATGNTVTVTDNLPAGLEAIPGGTKGIAGSLLSAGTIDYKPG